MILSRLSFKSGVLVQLILISVYLSYSLVLAADETKVEKNETAQSTIATTPTSTSTTTAAAIKSSTTSAPIPLNLLQLASHPAFKTESPPTLTDFIRDMMKKYGEVKAAEAFQSLDQLPLGLIMKILLVEVDKTLAADIIEMQRYAQSSDKALIMMIGRIVAGDKNVPKEIFAMDQKLMKFPWWSRIRQRMFLNLEKYVAAYSLVPVAAKSALSGASKSGIEAPVTSGEPSPGLSLAVAASATEATYINPQEKVKVIQAQAQTKAPSPVTSSPALAPAPAPVAPKDQNQPSTSSTNNNVDPLKLSLLNPLQQQEILETLALQQQLLQLQQLQQQQKQSTPSPSQTAFNPLAFLLG